MADKCDLCDGAKTIREGNVECPDCKGTGLNMAERVEHTHAKVGGGKLNHAHENASKGHAHAPSVKSAPDDALMPMDPPDDGDDDDAPGDAVGMAERPALFAMEFSENVNLAEGKPLPFLKVGKWDFPDYGHLEVTPEHLKVVKRFFDEDARRQDLPVINEAHDSERAVGWIKDLVFNGENELQAVPDYNPVGETLVKNDEYRYVSPELLRNWTDPETGNTFPIIAAGLALTNYPRMKALGRIAASENNPGLALIACSERPLTATKPSEARALLMADAPANDPDGDGDDDGIRPQCVYQPPNSPIGCCPGYTARGDTDGDGTCLMADRGCNGYIGVQPLPVVSLGNSATAATITSYYGEHPKSPTTNPNKGTLTMSEDTTQEPETPEKPEGEPVAVLMAEKNALAEKFAESENRNAELAARVAAMERRETLSTIKAEFSELVRTGRVTPAEVEKLIGDEDNAIKLSEHSFVLDALKARPANSAVNLSEKGAAGDDAPSDAHQQLVAMAEEIKNGSTDKGMTFEQAYASALEKNPQLYAELRTAQNARTRVSVA